MTPEVLNLSLLLLSIAGFSAWLIVKVPTSYKLKFLLVPLVLGVAVFATRVIPTIMGTPVQEYPENAFAYVGHKVSQDESGKVTIELWAEESGEGEGKRSRLYEFPFDQGTADKLRQMQEMASKGIPVEGKFSGAGIEDGQEITESLEVIIPDTNSLLPPKDVDPGSLIEDRRGVVPYVPPNTDVSEHDGF